MVKTASQGDSQATFMFRRQGPSFFAIVHEKDISDISEWPLEEAIQAIECSYETKRISFSQEFWSCGKDDKGKEITGIYNQLKEYSPPGLRQHGGISDTTQAVANIQNAMPQMTQVLKQFARDVIEDLQSYGTIPQYTIRLLAKHQTNSEADIKELSEILNEMKSLRGSHYLKAVKASTTRNDIIVTIEKR